MLVGDELAGGWPSALITRRERQRTYRAPLALLGFGRGRSANNDLVDHYKGIKYLYINYLIGKYAKII